MCVDYINLNIVYLKYLYPLPNIDKLADNSADYKLLSLMDTYFGYNQMLMHEADKDKTTFMTECTNYRYNSTPFEKYKCNIPVNDE